MLSLLAPARRPPGPTVAASPDAAAGGPTLARRGSIAVAAAASLGALAVAIWLSTRIDVGPRGHEIALFLHLAALVVGFGAVLAIDWVGWSWVRGRTSLPDVLVTISRLTTPIWLGLGGLVLTGIFLSPDTGAPRTLLKLALVALLTCNGHHARHLHRRLLAADGSPSRTLVARSLTSTTISQVCWWGASLIGFLNARS